MGHSTSLAQDCKGNPISYQTVVTTDPISGERICSLLLLQYKNLVAVESKFFYDISRDMQKATALREKLARGAVLLDFAEEVLEDWLG